MMPVKVLDQQGVGSSATAIAGVQYAVRNGARILNASWGGPVFDKALYDTVKWAGDEGALFVAAAGNDGKDNDTDLHPTYPASFALSNVIAVAAYDARDTLAAFSSYGKRTTHLGAPGVAIYSTARGGYHWGEGTSYAAPFVTGVAALLKSFLPALSLSALKERLLATTEVMGYYDKERTETAGRLSAINALRDVRPPRPLAPTRWTEKPATAVETTHPYPNDAKLVFQVQAPGAKHIRVHFSRFETESGFDQLVLRDSAGTVVKSYSGTLGEFWSADALGDSLRLEFSSDYSNNAFGFIVDRYGAAY
jgi:subtilisin family serine protease